jgi:hypothetical protein
VYAITSFLGKRVKIAKKLPSNRNFNKSCKIRRKIMQNGPRDTEFQFLNKNKQKISNPQRSKFLKTSQKNLPQQRIDPVSLHEAQQKSRFPHILQLCLLVTKQMQQFEHSSPNAEANVRFSDLKKE